MRNIVKGLLSIAAGAAAAFFGQYGLFFVFVAAAVVLDVVTGLIKAKATGEGLSSERAARGFWRKMALFAALAFGIFLDYAAGAVLVKAGVSFAGELPFALIVCAYIIINESISIAENLYLANPESFPKWIAKRLRVAREEMERETETEEEEEPI